VNCKYFTLKELYGNQQRSKKSRAQKAKNARKDQTPQVRIGQSDYN